MHWTLYQKAIIYNKNKFQGAVIMFTREKKKRKDSEKKVYT